jgi:voltage-gated potassium channel Kch
VDIVRRFGNKVYYGDPTRADLLRAAGAEQAKLLIVALDNMADVVRVVEVAKRNFPQLKIMARARNRRHAYLLMDRGVDGVVRDTFYSSLKLAEDSLMALGISPEDAARSVALFRAHDEQNLLDTHAIYRDEKQFIQSARQATEELAALFEADQAKQPGNPQDVHAVIGRSSARRPD